MKPIVLLKPPDAKKGLWAVQVAANDSLMALWIETEIPDNVHMFVVKKDKKDETEKDE